MSDCNTCDKLVFRNEQDVSYLPANSNLFQQMIGETIVDYHSASSTTWKTANMSNSTIVSLLTRGYLFRESSTKNPIILSSDGTYWMIDPSYVSTPVPVDPANTNSGQTPNPVYEDCDAYGWDVVGYWECKTRNASVWTDKTNQDFEQWKIDAAKNAADALAATQKAAQDALDAAAKSAADAAAAAALALKNATDETRAALEAAAAAAAKAAADAAAAAGKGLFDGINKSLLIGGAGILVLGVVLLATRK